MPRPPANRPTDGELEILDVLWRRGPSTVRQVYEELAAGKTVGYTTILKLMQIMADKRLVVRDERQRTHIYRSRVPQETTQRQIINDLMERVFGGSARALVLQALSAKKATPQELAQIRELLDQFESKNPPAATHPKMEKTDESL
jgi:predicted transcriptional regulator